MKSKVLQQMGVRQGAVSLLLALSNSKRQTIVQYSILLLATEESSSSMSITATLWPPMCPWCFCHWAYRLCFFIIPLFHTSSPVVWYVVSVKSLLFAFWLGDCGPYLCNDHHHASVSCFIKPLTQSQPQCLS